MKIVKNNNSFIISNDPYSQWWFGNNKLDGWEKDTFHILDHYKNHKGGVYIDIGAWIGPTVLYSANIYNKVVAIEPDPVARNRLISNLVVNNFKNIILVSSGLSDKDGTSIFGGNGALGNSESTLLISNKDEYMSYPGHQHNHNQSQTITINTMTIETLIEKTKIDPEHISLIKMDIEGGEKIVVPALVNFLKKYKPVFYISLHRCFLRESDIETIIDILFDVYDKCYQFTDDNEKLLIDKEIIKEKNLCSLVFE